MADLGYMYRVIEGVEYRSKITGIDPDWGFPLTLNQWEPIHGPRIIEER